MDKVILCMLPILLFAFGSQHLQAQSKMPVKVSIFSESTSVPFSNFLPGPFHPGVQVGTEFGWKESNHFRLYPAVNIGYMFHSNLFHGIYVNAEVGFDYHFNFGLNIKSSLGLGYLHTFTTQQEFQFENGQYQSRTDRGNSRLMPSLSLGLGYRLDPSDSRSAEIFIMHQTWLEYPYSPGFIPLMSHSNTHVGSKFYPFKNSK